MKTQVIVVLLLPLYTPFFRAQDNYIFSSAFISNYSVFYMRVTDSNGQAKLNIRLMPGKYIITSSYNGASISNNITVSA